MNKIQNSIEILKRTEKLALKYKPYGFHLAFSGGKDSQLIYELCKIANVKFKAFFYKTSVDPPELLQFIKQNYPDVIWIKPEMTMFQLIIKKGMLPLRHARYCCAYIKERNGLNEVTITGIRKAESNKRAKRIAFEQRCVKGNDKILLNPILNFTNNDVWQLLKNKGIESCSLYSEFSRIGCVGCPMNPKSQRKEFIKYPNFKLAYTNTVGKLMVKGKYNDFDSPDEVIKWWTSGISKNKFMARKLQYSLGI